MEIETMLLQQEKLYAAEEFFAITSLPENQALEYLRSGTKLVWAVYTDEKVVYVMRLDEEGELRSRAYGIDATLDGGGVLPGFTLPVREIFPT